MTKKKKQTKEEAGIDLAISLLCFWEDACQDYVDREISLLQDLASIVVLAYSKKRWYREILRRVIDILDLVDPRDFEQEVNEDHQQLVDTLTKISVAIEISPPKDSADKSADNVK